MWLGCASATGHHLVGHEVKVSRADVLTELSDLTKTDPWQRYCDYWWLVVPDPALIRGLELPESWGVMLPPSGRRTRSMTIHRKAPKLTPLEQSPALRALAAWQCWVFRDLRNTAADREKRLGEALQRVAELKRAALPRTHNPTREMVEHILAALGGAYDSGDGGDPGSRQIGDWRQRVAVEDIIAALRDLGALYQRRDEALRTLERTRERLLSQHAALGHALTETATPDAAIRSSARRAHR
jgi:hypothetical protein